MKRRTRTILIVAGSFFLAGLIAAGIGFVCGGYEMFIPEPGVEKSYTAKNSAEDLEKIYIDTCDGDIHFQKSAGDQVIIGYYDYENLKHTVTEENGVLQITANDKEWYDYVTNFGSWTAEPITVYVPERFDGEIQLDTSNGDIALMDLNKVGVINCKTSNGDMFLHSISVEKEILLETSNGKIELENITTGADLITKTSNGSINGKEITANSCDLKTSNGKVTLENVTAPHRLKVKSSNGELELLEAVSDNISLDTSVGDVTGTIKGRMSDYQIYCDDDGNLPKEKTTGSKKLEADTSAGKIDIQFTED